MDMQGFHSSSDVDEGFATTTIHARTLQAVMTEDEHDRKIKALAKEVEYYDVILKDDFSGAYTRVRIPIYQLDAERRPVLDENNKRIILDPMTVALGVWGACGDDYTLQMVMRGGVCKVTPETIANDIAMGHAALGAEK